MNQTQAKLVIDPVSINFNTEEKYVKNAQLKERTIRFHPP